MEPCTGNNTATTTPNDNNNNTVVLWHVGQLVHVKARTWPGVNRPGGVGRVTHVDDDDRVAVRYVLDGRRERDVDAVRYVRPYHHHDDEDDHHENNKRLRDRSLLLGRCRRCGSLRSDCGSCDLATTTTPSSHPIRRSTTGTRRDRPSGNDNGSSSGSDSDDDSDDDDDRMMMRDVRRLQSKSRRLARLWQRARRFLKDDDESSSGDDRDEPAGETVKSQRQQQSATLNAGSEESASRTAFAADDDDDDQDSSLSDTSEEEAEDTQLLQTLTQPPTRRRPLSSRIAGTLTPSKSHRREATSPSSPPIHDDDDDDPFIQPEGRADVLPADVRDESRHVPYGELPAFVDALVRRLETIDLPTARRTLVRSERRRQDDEARRHLQTAYDAWIQRLVRRGVDQCQMALRRIASRRRRKRRHHHDDIPPHRRKDFSATAMELRETRVDNLSRSVEEVMLRMRQLQRWVKGNRSDDDDDDDPSRRVDDDGWADPHDDDEGSQSVPPPEDDTAFAPADDDDKADNAPWDPHPHASRGRRAATRRGRFVLDRRRKGTRRRPPTTTGRQSRSVERRFRIDDNAPVEEGDNGESAQASSVDGKDDDDGFGVDRESEGRKDRFTSFGSRDGRKRVTTTHSTHGPNRNDRDDAKRPKRAKRSRPTHASVDDVSAPERTTAPDREPVRARLERFLRVNAEHVEGTVSATPSPSRRPKRRRKSSWDGANADIPSDRQARDGNGSRDIVSLRDELFSELRSLGPRVQADGSRNETVPVQPAGDSVDVKSLCDALRGEYRSPSGRKALEQLSARCLARNNFTTASDAQEAFSTLWNCLKEQGGNTFQFFVALQPSELSHCIQLHAAFLDALKGLQGTNNNRLVEEIMAPVVASEYVRFVAMQMVDTILSLLLPQAWGVTANHPTRLLRNLDRLRRSLGRHCNVLETCAECLTERLPSQQWRVTLDETNAYISCIDPKEWKSFLETGTVALGADIKSTLRYGNLRSMSLPRSEADALWGLLGYVGAERGDRNNEAVNFRRIVSALFSRGPLLSSPDEAALPPSPFQIESCLKELSYVSALLKAKTVDGTTMKDSILQNLIRQSVGLAADFVGGVEEARIELFPAYDKASGDWGKLKLFRKRCDIMMEKEADPIPSIQTIDPSDLFSLTSTFLGQHDLLPTSRILRNCLELFVQWYGLLSLKRARYAGFEKSKNILVKHFKDMGSKESKQTLDAFQQAFSTNIPAQSGQGSQLKGTLYLEMAAYLELFYAVLLDSSSELPAGVRRVDSLDLLSKIWGLLTQGIMDKDPSAVEPYHLFVCARVATSAGLLCEGIWPAPTDDAGFGVTPESSDITVPAKEGNRRNFVLDCLVFCLERACISPFVSAEVLCSILLRIAVYFDSTVKADIKRLHQSSTGFLPSHLAKLEELCKKCIKTMISSSYCGSEEDICLSMALLVADFVASFRSSEAAPVDEWGGLDDSLFAAIDVDGASSRDSEETLEALLATSLLNATPSQRYVSHSNTRRCAVSVQGRMLVARRMKWIIRSLVLRSTVSCDPKAMNSLSCLWSIVFWANSGENSIDDLEYSRDAAFALAGEFCQLWKSPLSQDKAITFNPTTLALKAVEFVLDASAVSRIPSQELAARVLRERSRDEGSAKELMMYKDLKRGELKLMKKCDRQWFVCKAIAYEANFASGRTKIFDAFRGAFEQHNPDEISLPLSMERELLRRFDFLLHLFHLAPSRDVFEITSVAVIGILSTEVAKSLRKLKSLETSLASHSHAKEVQVLQSYADLLASVLTQVLLQGTSQGLLSDRVRLHLLNDFLIPSLSKRKRAMELVEINCSFAASIVNKAPLRIQTGLANSAPWNAYDDCFVGALRNRSTQIASLIFYHVSESDSGQNLANDLTRALVTSIDETETASVVTRGLLRCCGLHDQPDIGANGVLSLEFERLLSKFLPRQWEAKTTDNREADLVTYTLESVIGKMLRRPQLKRDDRLRRLRLLQSLLEELKICITEGKNVTLEPTTLASIGNGISASVWSAVSSKEVDGVVLESSLLCASTLYGLPSKVLSGGDFRFGWITDWCSEPNVMSNSVQDAPQEYVSHILTLCTTICETLEVMDQSRSSENFREYRKRLAEGAAGSWMPLGAMRDATTNSINLLEKQLGFVTAATSRHVNNVYANKKGSGEMVDFLPDAKTLSAARRFCNEIRRV